MARHHAVIRRDIRGDTGPGNQRRPILCTDNLHPHRRQDRRHPVVTMGLQQRDGQLPRLLYIHPQRPHPGRDRHPPRHRPRRERLILPADQPSFGRDVQGGDTPVGLPRHSIPVRCRGTPRLPQILPATRRGGTGCRRRRTRDPYLYLFTRMRHRLIYAFHRHRDNHIPHVRRQRPGRSPHTSRPHPAHP